MLVGFGSLLLCVGSNRGGGARRCQKCEGKGLSHPSKFFKARCWGHLSLLLGL